MRKAIAVCGVILLGSAIVLLGLGFGISLGIVDFLGPRKHIAIAENPDIWGTLGFEVYLEGGHSCIVEITDAKAHNGSAYINIHGDYVSMERAGASQCTGSFTMKLGDGLFGDYEIKWSNLDSVSRITVYEIKPSILEYALLPAGGLVLLVAVIILDIGFRKIEKKL